MMDTKKVIAGLVAAAPSVIKTVGKVLEESKNPKFILKSLDKSELEPKALQKIGLDILLISMDSFKSIGKKRIRDIHNNLPHLPMIAVDESGQKLDSAELIGYGFEDYVEIRGTGEKRMMDSIRLSLTKKALQESARKKLEFYSTLVNEIGDGVYIINPEGFEYVNPVLERILGYKSEEICAPWFDFLSLVHPDDRKLIIEREEARKKKKKIPLRYSFRIITKDGNVRTVEVNTVPLKGEKIRVLGILRDISDTVVAEERVKEREKLYRLLTEQAQDLIYRYRIKPDPGFEYVSPSVEKLTGFTPEDHYNDPQLGFKMVHPEDRTLLEKMGTDITMMGKPFVIRWIRKDGKILWTEQITTPILNDNGELVALEGIARDITERMKVEDERDRLFNYSIDMFCIAGFDGYFKQLNPAWEKYLGWKIDEMLKRPWLNFIHPDDIEKTKKVDQKLRNNEAVYFSENRYLCKDGSYRWLSWNSFPLKEENLIFCVARDITRIKETTEALKSLTARYETLLDEVPNIIAEVDLNKRYVWMNRSGLEFYGDDVIGREAAEFFVGPQDTYAKVDPLFSGADDLVYVESFQRRKDGEERMLAWWCKTLKDDKGKATGVLATAQDVTELKKSESVIKQSEKKYRDLVEQINDVVFSIDMETKITYISPVIKQISGYAPEEMTGRSYLDFVFSEDLPILKLLFEERISGKIAPHEFRIVTKTGEHLWVRTSSRQIVKDNMIIGLQGVLTDISESKLAEEALKESEERFRIAFKTSPDAIYITRFDDGLIIYINDGFTAWSGYSREDVFGKTYRDLGLWVDKTEWQELLDKISKEGFVNRFETRFRTRDGRTRIVTLSATVMQIRNQKYLFAIARDIDDLKKAEEALLAEKERLSITLRSIGEGVIAIDLAGRVVLMNRIAEDLTGWIQDEALGKPIKEVFNIVFEDTRNACSDIVSNAMRSGETMEPHNDFILISGRGLEKTVNFTATPIRDTENQIIGSVLVFRDVSEKREMEEELRKSQKLESIGVLAGGIAHDFNNILSAILANISLAKITMPENRKAATRLEEAEKAVLRAQGLTQQLLTFSKGGAPVKETSDIREILKDTSLFTLSGSNTKADFAISDDLSPLDVDKGQFSQVINNLVINADQSMPKGGVIKIKAVNIKVGPESSLRLEPGNYVRISISDNGEGIAPENLSKVFDPYFTTRSSGSGLGLSTVYSIVKRHKGEIRIESKVEIGTTFTIYLPVSKSIVVQRAETQAQVIKGNGRILLMDDEAVIRDVAKEVLEFLGYEASLAKDGESMLEIFKKANAEGKPFDVVILDLTIPGGPGGKEVVKELTKIDPAIKVIAASGYSNDPVMANYKAYGFNGILPKPFTIKDVGFVLKKVLEI